MTDLLKLAEQIEAAEMGEQADALYNAWNALAPKFALYLDWRDSR